MASTTETDVTSNYKVAATTVTSVTKKYVLRYYENEKEFSDILYFDDNGNVEDDLKKDKYMAYDIGDEVIIGKEHFFVLESSDENQSTVTLITKYNLTKDGDCDTQSTTVLSDTACDFSQTQYWSGVEGYGNLSDLNNLKAPNSSDAINKAINYAENKYGAARGRLLRYGEAVELSKSENENVKKMLSGDYNEGGYLSYWLGNVWNDGWVCFVGNGNISDGYWYKGASPCGVRPVLEEVPKLVGITKVNEN